MSYGEYPEFIQWQCDGEGCGLTLEFPLGSFWPGLNEIKARGWQIQRYDDGWLHYCARCRKKEASWLDRKPKVVGR